MEFIGDMPSRIPTSTLYEERMEKLESENTIFREALERIAKHGGKADDGRGCHNWYTDLLVIAREALQRAGGE